MLPRAPVVPWVSRVRHKSLSLPEYDAFAWGLVEVHPNWRRSLRRSLQYTNYISRVVMLVVKLLLSSSVHSYNSYAAGRHTCPHWLIQKLYSRERLGCLRGSKCKVRHRARERRQSSQEGTGCLLRALMSPTASWYEVFLWCFGTTRQRQLKTYVQLELHSFTSCLWYSCKFVFHSCNKEDFRVNFVCIDFSSGS